MKHDDDWFSAPSSDHPVKVLTLPVVSDCARCHGGARPDAPQEFLTEARQERAAQAAEQNSALMRALGLAHHWQRLLDEERVASVAEIAKAEGMDVTQVRRVMRLTRIFHKRGVGAALKPA